jgi:hypothetical protein
MWTAVWLLLKSYDWLSWRYWIGKVRPAAPPPRPPAGWTPIDRPASGGEMPTALNTLHVEEFATASDKALRRLAGRRIKFVGLHCPQCAERMYVPIESFTVRREPRALVADRSLVCGYDNYRQQPGCGATFPVRLDSSDAAS